MIYPFAPEMPPRPLNTLLRLNTLALILLLTRIGTAPRLSQQMVL